MVRQNPLKGSIHRRRGECVWGGDKNTSETERVFDVAARQFNL